MAGISIATNMNPRDLLILAGDVAHDLGFAVTRTEELGLKAQKGSLPASIFLGAFIAYCNFTLFVEESPNRGGRLTLERNSPWWTGVIGISRVKSRAKELAEAIEDTIKKEGFEILKWKEF